MENTAKGFRVELDYKLKLCFLKVWGSWSQEDGVAYVNHFAKTISAFAGADFDVVADISQFPTQKPDVNEQISQTMRHAATNGMKRAANVVSSAMTQLQIRRLSEETGLPEFSFFTSTEAAVKWLRPEKWERSIAATGQWK